MHTLPATHIEVAAWLRLSLAPGLKPAALRLLLSAFGLPEVILQHDHQTLAAIAGDAAARAALAPTSPEFNAQLDAVIAWRELPGNHLVTLDDPVYPPALLTMPDPPPLLYIKGRLDLLHSRAVALVGSRSATPQGTEDAERFARTLSMAGVTVVSGLAQGIDGAAHRGGLEGAGSTVAVIGTGADLVYPAAHHALARQIALEGAILSEWPLGTPARAANFPQRNRLIAGLVSGVVMVEAAMRSGSLITARLANESGREVMAVPGSPLDPRAQGCNLLIREGATLVQSAADILEQIRPFDPRSVRSPIDAFAATPTQDASDADRRRIADLLGPVPVAIDELIRQSRESPAVVHTVLLELELAGRLERHAGGRVSLA